MLWRMRLLREAMITFRSKLTPLTLACISVVPERILATPALKTQVFSHQHWGLCIGKKCSFWTCLTIYIYIYIFISTVNHRSDSKLGFGKWDVSIWSLFIKVFILNIFEIKGVSPKFGFGRCEISFQKPLCKSVHFEHFWWNKRWGPKFGFGRCEISFQKPFMEKCSFWTFLVK